MCVYGTCEIFGRTVERHRGDRLGDQLRGLGPEDVHAQEAIGVRIGQDLDHPRGFARALRAAAGHEWETAGAKRNAVFFEFALGPADPGDLGVGVDHPGHQRVVHVGRVARDHLGDGHTFLGRLVRQHRSVHAVAHRPDAVDAGAALFVHHDAAALVQRQAGRLGREPLGVGAATDRDHQPIHLQ